MNFKRFEYAFLGAHSLCIRYNKFVREARSKTTKRSAYKSRYVNRFIEMNFQMLTPRRKKH